MDDRQMSIGEKRNKLIDMATGQYIAFVDDDDEVSRFYVQWILDTVKGDFPDCVGICGTFTWKKPNGRIIQKKNFFHTLKNSKYFDSPRGFERTINHLNPVKRELVCDFLFPEINHGEDSEWAAKIQAAGVLKTEKVIEKPIYFYNYVENKRY